MESKITLDGVGFPETPEAFLAAIVESSDDAIVGKSLDGTILSWNSAAERIFGYTAGEAIGKPISLIIPDERLDDMHQILSAVGRGERIEHFETKRRRKDGTIIDVSISVSPIVRPDGTIAGASKFARDITKLKMREGEMATLHSHLAAIVDSSDDIIVGKDLTGRIVSWNKAAERTFGYSADEAIGQSISLIIPRERFNDMLHILGCVARGEKIEHFETQRITRDGRLLDVALTVSPIRNEKNEIVGASKIGRDITQAKAAQRELEQKRLKLHTLYEAGRALTSTLEPHQIYSNMRELVSSVMDCDGLIVSSYSPSDQMIRATFAWIEGELTDVSDFPTIPLAPEGQGLQSSVIRSGKPLLVSNVEEAVQNSQTSYHVDPGGKVSTEPDSSKPQTRSMLLVPIELDSEVIGVVQVLSHNLNAYDEEDLDLMEGLVIQMAAATKNAELYQRARESEAQFRLLANSMPQIAWSLDAHGEMDFLNARYTEYTGLDIRSEPQAAWNQIVHPDDASAASAAYRHAVENGEIWEQELRLRRKDGEYRWHLSRLVPVVKDGNIFRWFATSTDIHAKKEAEELARREGEALRASQEELRLLNAELEQRVEERTSQLVAANQELEGFTYSVSHDLRAPLRSIMSSSMIMIEDFEAQLPEEAKGHLRRQATAAKKLAALIDDLLQYSRIGRKRIEPQHVSLSTLAEGIVEDYRRRVPERSVEWHIQPGLDVNGDANLLGILLQNLLDNAFKFTRNQERPVIELGRDEEGFYVRDNGVGFEMQYVTKLFMPFERLHREADYEGTGIGLANVKRIVERHGGKIWAEGVPDQGAVFRFTLK